MKIEVAPPSVRQIYETVRSYLPYPLFNVPAREIVISKHPGFL